MTSILKNRCGCSASIGISNDCSASAPTFVVPKSYQLGDAFISGEIKHHHALAMADRRLVALECGHFGTEEPGIRALSAALQKEINTVECNVRIYVSEVSAYSFPRQP